MDVTESRCVEILTYSFYENPYWGKSYRARNTLRAHSVTHELFTIHKYSEWMRNARPWRNRTRRGRIQRKLYKSIFYRTRWRCISMSEIWVPNLHNVCERSWIYSEIQFFFLFIKNGVMVKNFFGLKKNQVWDFHTYFIGFRVEILNSGISEWLLFRIWKL